MAPEGPERASQAPSLTSLPRVEDLPSAADGFDREQVREAFEAFRRHTTQLQVQLRVLQAAGRSGVEPTGHAVRMDAMHMIRAAAEMADTIERDAQTASAAQLRRTEEEVSRRQRELQERQGDVDKYRQESERLRAEMLNAAKSEARKTTQEAEQQASKEITEAESRAARLLEQARHQATELTNATRAEVEQTLEWARGLAGLRTGWIVLVMAIGWLLVALLEFTAERISASPLSYLLPQRVEPPAGEPEASWPMPEERTVVAPPPERPSAEPEPEPEAAPQLELPDVVEPSEQEPARPRRLRFLRRREPDGEPAAARPAPHATPRPRR